jgi:cyclopropane-fatty-acyl-phospholipid synthase
MNAFEIIVSQILSTIDVEVGGSRPWDIRVHDDRFFRRAALEGSMGLGESYMAGWWDCDDLEELVFRFVDSGIEDKARMLPGRVALEAFARLVNRQPRALGEKTARHYNTDNELFTAFLGKYKNYSCAYYEDGDDLDAAQFRKMETICRGLGLAPGERVLDIGCGWGEIAKHMASTRGCQVTSISIAEEQVRYADEYCRDSDVVVENRDYRDIEGTFDKIAIIAMMSHVGHKNHRALFEKVHRHLAPGGAVFIDTVGSDVSLVHGNPWIDKYIFPGIVFPSIAQISKAVEGLFVIESIRNYGPAYAKTLRAWNANMQAAWPMLSRRHSEQTRRMFEFFFLSVAGFFRARDFQNWTLVLSRRGTEEPLLEPTTRSVTPPTPITRRTCRDNGPAAARAVAS